METQEISGKTQEKSNNNNDQLQEINKLTVVAPSSLNEQKEQQQEEEEKEQSLAATTKSTEIQLEVDLDKSWVRLVVDTASSPLNWFATSLGV